MVLGIVGQIVGGAIDDARHLVAVGVVLEGPAVGGRGDRMAVVRVVGIRAHPGFGRQVVFPDLIYISLHHISAAHSSILTIFRHTENYTQRTENGVFSERTLPYLLLQVC
jgi:hypothetical protein